MSATGDLPYIDRLNLADLVSRIERQNAETHKFVEEGLKLGAEAMKLGAEAAKFNRERVLAPWLASAAVIGGLLGLLTFAARLLGH